MTLARLVLLMGLLVAAPARNLFGAEADEMVVGAFSGMTPGGAVTGWEAMTFEKIKTHTRYALVVDGNQTVLKARSSNAASGMVRNLAFSLSQYPVLRWRWKIDDIIEKGDVSNRDGDDYPARIYLTFNAPTGSGSFWQRTKRAAIRTLYGKTPPSAAIAYVWANRAAKGSIHPNPYTNRVQMIVVESGPSLRGRWQTERRDVVEDYTAAFGTPPPPISGIAVMTDTDNTGSDATAWYGDIVFKGR